MPEFPDFPPSPTVGAPRFAIYFAPAPDSALARFGASWLGRDCADDTPRDQPSVPGVAGERLDEMTASARRYGFHATLKPPFHLASGSSPELLDAALAAFAGARSGFEVRLALKSLGGFLALMMAPSDHRMNALAADVVREFDPFRAPPDPAELARRRAARLSSHQETLLQRWGYPYVMGEFRFHMTLTERLAEGSERDAVLAFLTSATADVTREPVAIDGLSLFRQDDREAPFVLAKRYGFAA